MSFAAKYHGTCTECREHIAPGNEVEYGVGGLIVHVDECSAAAPERPTVTCTDCWIIKPCECDS